MRRVSQEAVDRLADEAPDLREMLTQVRKSNQAQTNGRRVVRGAYGVMRLMMGRAKLKRQQAQESPELRELLAKVRKSNSAKVSGRTKARKGITAAFGQKRRQNPVGDD